MKTGAARLLGTAVVALATTAVMAAGYAAIWTVLLADMPTWFGIVVLIGLAVAPMQFAMDILEVDREGRREQR